ncbi:hypothetical protein [Roseibium sp. Sym1]|uniref:hypothetical protein n=1 Tax=Roseibium sp. Sym1 TaxID=3016006 RepID=UPI0022B49DD4|nr:hypothetical protein [Roseibium sp. Sym1]
MDRRQLLISGLAFGVSAGFGIPGSAKASGEPLKLRALYNKDRSFSDLAKSLEGRRITVDGFMAPPLKAEIRFFVLTKKPLAVCPFCETEAEWPDDILAIYTKRTVEVISFNRKIETSGVLELGSFKDPDTGFVSRVRLVDSVYGLV